jgi:hypothetical protein
MCKLCWYLESKLLASGWSVVVNLLHQERDKRPATKEEVKSGNSQERKPSSIHNLEMNPAKEEIEW